MPTILDQIAQMKIVPVVVIENADDAQPLAHALVEGGLPIAEVTFRTEAAPEAIKRLSKFHNLLLGAGTVLTVHQAKQAVESGAKFLVSPGLNPDVVEWCIDNSIPIVPGVCTPTEIEKALSYDLKVLKFFPAEAMGGLKVLKAVSGPYGMVKFIPTGGINADNINDYLAFDKVHACGGSWMVKKDLISSASFDEITNLTQQAVKLVSHE